MANTRYFSPAVPSGKKWLVKHVTGYVNDNAVRNYYFWHQIGGVDYPVLGLAGVPAFGVAGFAGLTLVCEAGDKFGYSLSANSTDGRITINGALL